MSATTVMYTLADIVAAAGHRPGLSTEGCRAILDLAGETPYEDALPMDARTFWALLAKSGVERAEADLMHFFVRESEFAVKGGHELLPGSLEPEPDELELVMLLIRFNEEPECEPLLQLITTSPLVIKAEDRTDAWLVLASAGELHVDPSATLDHLVYLRTSSIRLLPLWHNDGPILSLARLRELRARATSVAPRPV